jgi:hypothetical protein
MIQGDAFCNGLDQGRPAVKQARNLTIARWPNYPKRLYTLFLTDEPGLLLLSGNVELP